MSDTKHRGPPRPARFVSLTPQPARSYPTGTFIRWRVARPQKGESVRWECVDASWVSVALGHGADIGHVLVRHSDGRCTAVDSYEGALELARRWRG